MQLSLGKEKHFLVLCQNLSITGLDVLYCQNHELRVWVALDIMLFVRKAIRKGLIHKCLISLTLSSSYQVMCAVRLNVICRFKNIKSFKFQIGQTASLKKV